MTCALEPWNDAEFRIDHRQTDISTLVGGGGGPLDTFLLRSALNSNFEVDSELESKFVSINLGVFSINQACAWFLRTVFTI